MTRPVADDAPARRTATVARTTNETDIAVDARPRRDGAGGGVDRHPVLRPHARPARPSRRLRPVGAGRRRPRDRRPPHGRGRRHRPRRGLPRRAGRQGGRAPLRLDPGAARRGAGRRGPRPVRSAVPRLRGRLPRREDPRRPAVRPAAGRGVLAGVRHRRRHHPAHHAGAGAQHPPHHRGHVQGRGPVAARRGARRGRRRPVHQGQRCDPASPSSTTASATSARPRRRSSTSAPTPGSPPTRGSSATPPGWCCPGWVPSAGAWSSCAATGWTTSPWRPSTPGGPSSASASACRCSTTAPTRRPACAGLGVLAGRVRLLPDGVKRPQMQWNVLDRRRPSPLLGGLERAGVGVLRPLLRRRGRPTTWWPRATTAGAVAAAVERGNAVGHPVPPREVRGHRTARPRQLRRPRRRSTVGGPRRGRPRRRALSPPPPAPHGPLSRHRPP